MSHARFLPDDDELDRIVAQLAREDQDWLDPRQREKLRQMFTGQHRCDLEAYRLLKRCSEDKNIAAWNKWRTKNCDTIYLQGADLSEGLSGSYYQQADFSKIHF